MLLMLLIHCTVIYASTSVLNRHNDVDEVEQGGADSDADSAGSDGDNNNQNSSNHLQRHSMASVAPYGGSGGTAGTVNVLSFECVLSVSGQCNALIILLACLL